ncbi:hypothetical protein DPMN_056567 [Dreissena polymorpha]|uniref:chitin synthase n=1 Tax=Dreissena polymorpha TaxID=45954 RepID=A0A9D4CSS6_DREPO|nr:hypothetical protein DPMN_056567 [Dreissena polymorpha]
MPPGSEEECFILTTDADVRFNVNSVEALLDLMTRDPSVGAVCARTRPLGSGPLVWYQVFEYAIGHLFQKVKNTLYIFNSLCDISYLESKNMILEVIHLY